MFNAGEQVLGTTTPLYTLALSSVGVVGLDLVQVSLVIGALAAAGNVCLVHLYVQHLGASRLTAVLTALLLAVAFPATMGVGNGMEAHVFVLVVLSSLVLSNVGHPRAAVAMASVSALIRPEGVLAVVLVLIATYVRRRPALKASLVTVAMTTAPWVAFAFVYFGSPIPNSVQAKSGDAFSLVTALPEGRFGRRLFNHFNDSLLGPTWDVLSGEGNTLVSSLGWLIALAAIGITVARVVRQGNRSIVLVGYPAAYFAFHFLSGVSGVSIQSWYLSPLTPFYLAMTMMGIEVGGRVLVRNHWRTVSLAAFVLLFAGQISALDLGQGQGLEFSTRSNLEREHLYARAARDLEPEVDLTTVIAAAEIGSLGYHSSASILDTLGLVSPESARFYPIDPREAVPGVENAMPTNLILELRPDYVVSLEVFIRESLLKSEVFDNAYEQVAFYPAQAFGSNGLYVFRIRS
ncbi:MAG: hypothetical protein OXG65_04035 [Chloroflexi bacterium]|nr:hypothetical protein [Chloroflexota bacterium]